MDKRGEVSDAKIASSESINKRRKTFELIATGIVTVLCSSCMDLPEPPPFKLVSSSPQQTHAVTIERKQRKPTEEDWTSWKIYLSYISQGQLVLNEVEVAVGDYSTGPYERRQIPARIARASDNAL